MTSTLRPLHLLIIGMAAFLCGCFAFLKDEKLTLVRAPIKKSIRLNGYYYHAHHGVPDYADNYFFYQNGVTHYLNGSSDSMSVLRRIKQDRDTTTYQESREARKEYWGVFTILWNEILIEKWEIEFMNSVFLRSGQIKNDTTFVIYNMESRDGDYRYEMSDTFRFRRFSPKPDSINEFVK